MPWQKPSKKPQPGIWRVWTARILREEHAEGCEWMRNRIRLPPALMLSAGANSSYSLAGHGTVRPG
jgi:hypothetical protein